MNPANWTALAIIAAPLAAGPIARPAHAQTRPQPAPGIDSPTMSDQEYMQRVMRAAPAQIVEQATVMRMQGGTMQTMRKGSNGWTCMEANGVPMCLDPGAMEWAHAWQTHGPPTDKTGFIYMLAGDTGASNTDPYAKTPTPDNHWVQTGSHVMIVGAAAKAMQGYSRSVDADPSQPYVMWPGSPYEHLMIPVK